MAFATAHGAAEVGLVGADPDEGGVAGAGVCAEAAVGAEAAAYAVEPDAVGVLEERGVGGVLPERGGDHEGVDDGAGLGPGFRAAEPVGVGVVLGHAGGAVERVAIAHECEEGGVAGLLVDAYDGAEGGECGVGLGFDGDEVDLRKAGDGFVDEGFEGRGFGGVGGAEEDPGVGEAVEEDECAAGVGGDGPVAMLAGEVAVDGSGVGGGGGPGAEFGIDGVGGVVAAEGKGEVADDLPDVGEGFGSGGWLVQRGGLVVVVFAEGAEIPAVAGELLLVDGVEVEARAEVAVGVELGGVGGGHVGEVGRWGAGGAGEEGVGEESAAFEVAGPGLPVGLAEEEGRAVDGVLEAGEVLGGAVGEVGGGREVDGAEGAGLRGWRVTGWTSRGLGCPGERWAGDAAARRVRARVAADCARKVRRRGWVTGHDMAAEA